ncbi:MAG: hypothetical protein A2Z20_07190 [Bdellovibrionales bacterium RBG_16_40_8]|nr:MAG: hypothetical protein A2Z20_07190 [Bdellovibrionales bacterium RBG_16_40_8]
MNTDSQALEATFSTLVISIASSAVVHLGLEKNPQTGKLEKNLNIAQYSIDLLVLLKDKTRNNLTESEKNYLDAIIQDLQMKFVQAK